MTVLRIRQDGDPILRLTATPVKEFGAELAKLAADMLTTMEGANGVGLAAPQVGHSIRLIVLKGTPWAICNPVITGLVGEQRSAEGCLSVPRERWGRLVKRAFRVHLTYHDLEGNQRRFRPSSTFAAIVQHEIDHLNGVLFTDYKDGRFQRGGGNGTPTHE
jgi:peptide deformylase